MPIIPFNGRNIVSRSLENKRLINSRKLIRKIISAPPSGSPTIVHTYENAVVSNDTTLTIPSVVSDGTNRMIVIALGYWNASTAVSSAVFNTSENLQRLGAGATWEAGDGKIEYWFLVNPSATTANIVFTFASAVYAGATVYVLNNAAQTTPRDMVATEGASTSPSTTQPTAVDELVFSAVSWWNESVLPINAPSGHSNVLTSDNAGSESVKSSTIIATSASEVNTWTFAGGAADWGCASTAVAAAS